MTHRLEKFLGIVKQPVFWVFAAAFGVRLFACLNTHIINPDGIHYIHQARAIFYHQWHALTACRISFISPLPFLIAPAFGLAGDWIAAGRSVSLFFSVATLFPLYFLIRRFFDERIAAITLLVYALIPVFVSRSADIVRGPIFWFLICGGMLMFVRHLQSPAERRWPLDLTWSCALFMLAAWTRYEGMVFILASGVYLVIGRSNDRLRRIFFFSLPVLVAVIALAAATVLIDRPLEDLFRTQKIQTALTQFLSHYDAVRDQLKSLARNQPGFFGEFLRGVRTVTWMVPLGLIFNTVLEGFFYPYALLFFIGWIGIRRRLSTDGGVSYFVCLLMFSTLVLYVNLLQTWLIYNRFLAIVIYPGFLFIGFGIDRLVGWLTSHCRLKPLTATVTAVTFVLLFGMAKNLRPNHEDKIVYRQAGEIIARQKAPTQVAAIAGAQSTVYEWVFFYAHRDFPGPLCARDGIKKIPSQYQALIASMRADGQRYLFYEENQWPRQAFDLMAAPFEQDFTILGRWRHKDTGQIMLLELKQG
ncbi:glycosyltransferase family 39 protein [uncultured Desulfosarcina sp.]|uniref:ArnT family glycosyltransferase n=1 Tax=uncultured Desulfosarcina sp. TaxID=218289 RepID=UPI0029C6FC75|nr:glycosyltransferase family 39 protein [uncultured Desulfosarcina sp.]